MRPPTLRHQWWCRTDALHLLDGRPLPQQGRIRLCVGVPDHPECAYGRHHAPGELANALELSVIGSSKRSAAEIAVGANSMTSLMLDTTSSTALYLPWSHILQAPMLILMSHTSYTRLRRTGLSQSRFSGWPAPVLLAGKMNYDRYLGHRSCVAMEVGGPGYQGSKYSARWLHINYK